MSDETGGRDRATVALVYHAVNEVKELINARFTDVQRQLDGIETLPGRVDGLDRIATDHERRLLYIEREQRDAETEKGQRSVWRSVHLPTLLLSACGLIVAALALFLH